MNLKSICNSDLKLNYAAGLGVKPRPVHVHPSKANTHCVKSLRQNVSVPYLLTVLPCVKRFMVTHQ